MPPTNDRSGLEKTVYMIPAEQFGASSAGGVDLGTIIRALWARKWLIFVATAVCIILSIVYALTAREWFRAEVLLAPSRSDSSQGISGEFAGLSSLAGLAGINVSAPGNAEPLAILTSRDFIEAFIFEEEILEEILSIRSSRFMGSDEFDLEDAAIFIQEDVLRAQEDTDRGLITVSIDWTSPDTAADWANLIVGRLNEFMRQRALAEAEANISFLTRELGVSNQVTLQQSIGRLLESELQSAMLARVNEEYAFRVIDDADPPKRRFRPNRRQVVMFSAILGLTVSCFLVLLMAQIRTEGKAGTR